MCQSLPVGISVPHILYAYAWQASDSSCALILVYAGAAIGMNPIKQFTKTYQKYNASIINPAVTIKEVVFQVACTGANAGTNWFRIAYLGGIEVQPATPAELASNNGGGGGGGSGGLIIQLHLPTRYLK